MVVVERFARELAVFAGSGGGLSGEVGVGGCEMADADEVEGRDALLRCEIGELALHGVAVGEQLRSDVVFAGLPQLLERG